MDIKQILKGHVSPDTAYVVNDYPYGFRLRCKIRYWLEDSPKHGTRFVSQTTNPKKAGEVWNKPKASTYAPIAACMFLDEKGYVQHSGLGFYSDYAEAEAWFTMYKDGLTAEQDKRVQAWVTAKQKYEAAHAAQQQTA
jgi:hypothetical protein